MDYYKNYLLREAERRQEPNPTPYDRQLNDARCLRDRINDLLGQMRSCINGYHVKYGNIDALSNELQDAEGGLGDAMEDIIGILEKKAERFQHR